MIAAWRRSKRLRRGLPVLPTRTQAKMLGVFGKGDLEKGQQAANQMAACYIFSF